MKREQIHHGSRSRHWVVGVLALWLCLAACRRGARSTQPATPPPAPTEAERDRGYAALSSALSKVDARGHITTEGALELAALAFGPIPGVPAAPRGAALPVCGTLLTTLIRSRWATFSPEQQRAISARLAPQPAPSAQVVDAVTLMRQGVEVRAVLQEIERELLSPRWFGQRVPSLHPYHVRIFPTPWITSGCCTNAAAELYPDAQGLDPNRSHREQPQGVQIYNILVGQNIAQNPRSRTARAELAHELFHLVQREASTRTLWGHDSFYQENKPYLESTASWLGEAFAGGRADDRSLAGSWWHEYFDDWQTPSGRRPSGLWQMTAGSQGYSGGIWLLWAEQRGVPVRARVLSALERESAGGVMGALMSGFEHLWMDAAAASFGTRSDIGPEWQWASPQSPTGTWARRPAQVNVTTGVPLDFATPPYSQRTMQLAFSSAADVVRVVANMPGRIVWGGERRQWSEPTQMTFCRRAEGCQCPSNVIPTTTVRAADTPTLAVSTLPDFNRTVRIEALPFDQWCRTPRDSSTCDRGAPVDPCLTRRSWVLRNETARGAYLNILRNVAGNTDIQIRSVNGRQVLRFRPNHDSTIDLQAFRVVSSASVPGAPARAETLLVFSGQAQACFSANAGTITSSQMSNNIHVAVETRVMGFSTGPQGMNVPNDSVVFGAPIRYSCSDSLLTLTRDDPTPFTLLFDPQ